MQASEVLEQGRRNAASGWLARPFDISPDGRQAFGLSTALWAFVIFITSIFNILAGYVHVLGEYLTLLWGAVSAVGVAGLLFLVFRRLARRPVWLAIIVLPPAVIAAGWLQMWLDYAGQPIMNTLFDGMLMPDFSWTARTKVALVYVSIYATNAALFWVTFTNRRIHEQRQVIAEREAGALRAELRALRMQLNPHFMFNALSALSTLILTRRDTQAAEMLDRLSDFLRAAMEVDTLTDVSLADELSVLDAYLAVEIVRFGARLDAQIDCDPAVENARVPNLLLQPLVENAVKYGVEPSLAPVTVAISAGVHEGRLRLEVRDSGAVLRPGAVRPTGGHGVGLSAVRQRLDLRFGADASVTAGPEDGGYLAVIEMPLLQSPPGPAE
ncbi:sensor histidine kinase [Brevundimonas sp. NPDC092305]|uniref:sensor histidine kinase n=1 Tax=Brevundimonas sp. NPDC092305 TaxID=3363957 RepID=UPI003809AE91